MIKSAADLDEFRKISQAIYDEDPSKWPHGIPAEAFDDLYLVRSKEASVGFVGWQYGLGDNGQRVGYYSIGILPEHRGKGFAKAAVEKAVLLKSANFDEVRAFVVDGNAASEQLARSLGIQIDRTGNIKRAFLGKDSLDFTPTVAKFTHANPVLAPALGIGALGLAGYGLYRALKKPEKKPVEVEAEKVAFIGRLARSFAAAHPLTRAGIGAAASIPASYAENSFFGVPQDALLAKGNYLGNALMGASMAAHPSKLKAGVYGGLLATKTPVLALGEDALHAYKADAPSRELTAKLNLETAKTQLDQVKNLSLRDKILLGILGTGTAGGLAYMGHRLFADKKPVAKAQLVAGNGAPKRNAVTIKLPASSLPAEFYRAVGAANRAPKAGIYETPQTA